MEPKTVPLREAKARLGELAELAAAGTDVVIAMEGQPLAVLTAPSPRRKPVDLFRLHALTHNMPRRKRGAADAWRRLRDTERY